MGLRGNYPDVRRLAADDAQLLNLTDLWAGETQNDKGGGLDSTFGGNQATSMFGAAKSTDFIEKLTWYLAIALFVLVLRTD